MRRRELLGWIWVSAVIVAACGVCALAAWAAVPREHPVVVGQAADFPSGQPHYRALEGNLEVYVVNLDGALVAWDAAAPAGNRCQIKWVRTNGRFEDPCSANKWCLDGRLLAGPFPADGDLDRYALDVTAAGEVRLWPSRRIPGAPLDEAARQAHQHC